MNQKQIFNKIRNRIAFTILFSLACATSAIAADKISIGYLSSTGQGKFFIAKDAGIFEKNGLDVTLVEFSNSGDGIAADHGRRPGCDYPQRKCRLRQKAE